MNNFLFSKTFYLLIFKITNRKVDSMKKLALGITFLIFLSFFGCTAINKPVEPVWTFDCTIDINDGAVTGNCSISDTKLITVDYPKSLEGMKFSLDGYIISADLGGLSKSSDSEPSIVDFLPSKALMLINDLIVLPLNFVSQGDGKTMYTSGDTTVVVNDNGAVTYIKSTDMVIRFTYPQ